MIPNIISLCANYKTAWMKNTKRNTTRSSSCPWLLNFLEPLPNTSNQKALWMDKALSAWSLKNLSVQTWKQLVSSTRNWKKPLMKNKSSGSTIILEKKWSKISLPFVLEILFLIIFGTEILLTISKLPLLNAWGLKNAVATMITQGPFGTWCKIIPFSFCHCLPWINQLPLLRMRFGLKKLKFLSNCTIRQMRN